MTFTLVRINRSWKGLSASIMVKIQTNGRKMAGNRFTRLVRVTTINRSPVVRVTANNRSPVMMKSLMGTTSKKMLTSLSGLRATMFCSLSIESFQRLNHNIYASPLQSLRLFFPTRARLRTNGHHSFILNIIFIH